MPDPLPILPESLVLPERTMFGWGKLDTLFSECARFGARGVLVYGAALARDNRAERLLAIAPADLRILPVRHSGGEPTLAQVAALLEAAKSYRACWIAGVGGGSILDLAKAAAALFNAPRSPDYYHDGAALEPPGIPFAAAPTTAGTGAEATLNAVLTNERTGAKKSLRAPGLMARVVILDPGLLSACPSAVVAASGMDAVTQAIEAFTSRQATALSDQLALQGLGLLAKNLEAVSANAASPAAADLLAGSFLTGVALSFARLGVVHGIAHPLGSLYQVPHGLVCAACLPHAVELNREALAGKYEAMSQEIGEDLLTRVRNLTTRLGIESPFAGQPVRERDVIIRETLASGSTLANPKRITRSDVEWLLDRLFARALDTGCFSGTKGA